MNTFPTDLSLYTYRRVFVAAAADFRGVVFFYVRSKLYGKSHILYRCMYILYYTSVMHVPGTEKGDILIKRHRDGDETRRDFERTRARAVALTSHVRGKEREKKGRTIGRP